MPPGPGPPHRVGLGRDEGEVAEVEALQSVEEVDDGAPGSLEEVEDHLSIENSETVFF